MPFNASRVEGSMLAIRDDRSALWYMLNVSYLSNIGFILAICIATFALLYLA